MATPRPAVERENGVEIASKKEVAQAVRAALRELNLTAHQLKEQARTGRFSSERARLVWSAIRDVGTPT